MSNYPTRVSLRRFTILFGLTGIFFCGTASAVSDDERAQAFAARLETSMTAIEDSDRLAPRDRWDPAYVVETVGVEPEKLFTWVRGNVLWVPYRGALRGPVGVLMDRRGNSLDQALLLAALLRQAGKSVRLVHADLTGAAIDALWTRLSTKRVTLPRENARGPLSEADAKHAAEALASANHIVDTADTYGIDRASISESIKSSVTRGNSLAGELDQHGVIQATQLVSMVALPSSESSRRALEQSTRTALADHWWVQMSSGSGWLDLDPLAGEPKIGAVITKAASTVDLDALPEDYKHKVTIRVVVEQWKGGHTSEHVPLEQSFEPRNLLGVPVELLHTPAVWPSKWPEVTKDDVQIKMRAAVYSQSEWLPILLVGKDHFSRASIKDQGELNEHPTGGDPFRALGVSMIGNLQKGADVLATGGDPDAKLPEDKTLKVPNAPRPEGELTAEWIEFEIKSPDAPARKIRRQVFDILGAAARAGTSLEGFRISEEQKLVRSTAVLEQTEMLITPNAIAPEFLVHLLAVNALDNKEVLGEVSKDPFSKLPPNYVEIFSKLTSLPSSLYAFAGMRFDANPDAANVFIDRPNIVLQHGGLFRGGGGDFSVRYALDIVDNAVGIDPRTQKNPTELRLRQGVVDTNTEAAALRLTGQIVTANSAESFADAIKLGRPWTVLKPGDEAKVPTLKLPADPSARIVADLKAGNIVVALTNPGPDERAAWWRIDPVTGTTLGIGAEGQGQALVEYALVIIIQGIINTAQCMVAGAAREATEKALQDLDTDIASSNTTAEGIGRSIAKGAKAGAKQAADSWHKAWTPGQRHHCFAMGMMGAFDTGLMIANFELSKAIVRRGAPSGVGNETGENSESNKPKEESNNDAAEARKEAAEARKDAQEAKSDAEQAKAEAEKSKSEADEAKKSSEEQRQKDQEAESKKEKPQSEVEKADKAEEAAAKKLRDAHQRYEENPTPENKDALDRARRDLDEAADQAAAERDKEALKDSVEKLEQKHAEQERQDAEQKQREADEQKAREDALPEDERRKLEGRRDYNQAQADRRKAGYAWDNAIKENAENPSPENQKAVDDARKNYEEQLEKVRESLMRSEGKVDSNGKALPRDPGPAIRVPPPDIGRLRRPGDPLPPAYEGANGQKVQPQSGDTQVIPRPNKVVIGGTDGKVSVDGKTQAQPPVPPLNGNPPAGGAPPAPPPAPIQPSTSVGLSELESVLKNF